MKIFKAEQVREADAFTIIHEPISSIDLMERAATKLAEWIKNKYSRQTRIAIVVGPGNNGGDGLVLARQLVVDNYNICLIDSNFTNKYSKDFLINKKRFLALSGVEIKKWNNQEQFYNYDLIIDAIFGSGLTRAVDNRIAPIIHAINQSNRELIAIDIPSGLFGENNCSNQRENIIKADYTLTFQFPKLSFLLPENISNVGDFVLLDIGVHKDYIEQTASEYFYTEAKDLFYTKLKRDKFSHKGTFGHALIIAGSKGMMGASILSNKACLRSGVGLLSAFVEKETEQVMQIALPEAMTRANIQDLDFVDFSAICIGPGLGQTEKRLDLLTYVLDQVSSPIVFDADAINLIARNHKLLEKIPKESIFTPHPKELERLIGKTTDQYSRLYKAQEFTIKYQVYLLIKGANSVIIHPNGCFYFNSTGNPGMATAGSGDVLSGVITGLLAQGLAPFEALRTGVYIHGLAGDIAKEIVGEPSLIASDIIENVGNAYKKLGV